MGKTHDHRNRIEQWLAVGGGWWRLAVGSWAVVGGWRLAAGGPSGVSLWAVLDKEERVLKDSLVARDSQREGGAVKGREGSAQRWADAVSEWGPGGPPEPANPTAGPSGPGGHTAKQRTCSI